MPRQHAEPSHVSYVEELLHKRGASHVRARKRGAAVIIESGPSDNPVRHFRVRRDTIHLWCLDMAARNGRWERTPFRALLSELVDMVCDSFPWVLTPIPDNPERTYDPRY